MERGLEEGLGVGEEAVGGPVFEDAESFEFGARGHVAGVGEKVGVLDNKKSVDW